MYPPILLMHPDIAEQMLKPRYRVMSQANTNAERSGNRGMRFPWEQGVTGECPGIKVCDFKLGELVFPE